jgi:hypothetical protein
VARGYDHATETTTPEAPNSVATILIMRLDCALTGSAGTARPNTPNAPTMLNNKCDGEGELPCTDCGRVCKEDVEGVNPLRRLECSR